MVAEAFFYPNPRRWAKMEKILERTWAPPLKGEQESGRYPVRPRQPGKREAARRVLAILYPNGIPDSATLPNQLLCKAVAPHLPYLIENDTILRAAGRRK
jgi:hypothetical protein